MKRRNGLTVAAMVLLFAGSALASSIADPGGIIRPGSEYGTQAIIGPGLILTFNDVTFSGFDPFSAGFCHAEAATEFSPAGQECDFENQSGLSLTNMSQAFAAHASSFTGDNALSCLNQISDGGCGAMGNTLGFNGLLIPSTSSDSSEYFSALVRDTSGDPDFNVLYFGFESDPSLAVIRSTHFDPEPASLCLMGGGLLGLGLEWKRRRHSGSR